MNKGEIIHPDLQGLSACSFESGKVVFDVFCIILMYHPMCNRCCIIRSWRKQREVISLCSSYVCNNPQKKKKKMQIQYPEVIIHLSEM